MNSDTLFFNTHFPKPNHIAKLIELFFDAHFYNPSADTILNFENYLQLELENLCTKENALNAISSKKAIVEKIEVIKNQLFSDAQFILESDPASQSLEEVVLCYPGFYAIAVYRLANLITQYHFPLIARMLSEYAHSKTGIDIHPTAKIGVPIFIDHGTGVVIGATSVIGNRVKMYQGVTLGALQVNKCDATSKRHPTIDDDVVMYANCCVLGGETVVGARSIIGANAFVTKSIPPASTVYNKSNIEFKQLKDHFPLMYDI